MPRLLTSSLLLFATPILTVGALPLVFPAPSLAQTANGTAPARLLETAPPTDGKAAFSDDWQPEQSWMKGKFALVTEDGVRFIRAGSPHGTMRRTVRLAETDKALVLAARGRLKGFAQGKNPWDIMLVSVGFLDESGKSMANPWNTSLKFNKDQDWEDKTLVAPIPEGAKQARLEVVYKGSAGTFDVTNLRLATVPTVPTAAEAGALAAAAVPPPPPTPYLVDTSKVTGARIDEKAVQQTLEVGAKAKFTTLGAAWTQAMTNLKAGVPTRIRLAPGIYREGEFELDSRKLGGQSAETPLIIEAAQPGTVVISASDLYPAREWKPVKNAAGQTVAYEHPWKYDLGFRPGGWQRFNPKLTIEHRSEQVFINGKPLKQVELEVYKHTPVQPAPNSGWNSAKFPEGSKTDAFPGVPQNINKYGLYEYLKFRDPQTLPASTFGVAERPENGDRIFVSPVAGTDWDKAQVEVGVRQFHFYFFNKSNVVLRGLTLQHGIGGIESVGAVTFGHWVPQKTFTNNNILIEDCNLRWNNNNQLMLRYGKDITVRRTSAHYGAYGGMTANFHQNMLWEDNETNFNNWRVGGGWSSGAVKIHATQDATIRQHTSIGNDGTGLWFDITNANILVEDATLLHNKHGLDWEISEGMLFRRGLLAHSKKSNVVIVTGEDITIENSILYGAGSTGQFAFEASERPASQDINVTLERPTVEKYLLGPLTVRNSVIASPDELPVFFQEHGNPTWFGDFISKRYKGENNIWFSNSPKAFGTRRDYSKRPGIVNALTDWNGWQKTTGESGSQWTGPLFNDPENWDFTLKPDSPLKGRDLPTKRVAPEKLKAFKEFQSWGLGVKENPIEVENLVPTT